MPEPGIEKRLRYFNGQFLQERDFQDEQAYHVDRQRRHNRVLHTPGIAEGLDVQAEVGATEVTVMPGTAIDGEGRVMVLTSPLKVGIGSVVNQSALVVISYAEEPADQASAGGSGFTRMRELPRVEVVAESSNPPLGTHVRLAQISTDQDGKVNGGKDASVVRVAAGSRVGDQLKVRELVLSVEGIAPGQWPTLRAINANNAATLSVSGSLRVVGSLAAASLQVSGQLTAASLQVSSQLAVANLQVSGQLTVANLNAPNANATNLRVTGTLTASGPLTVTGPIGFGDSVAPMIFMFPNGGNTPTTVGAPRPIVAHSPNHPEWGLAYRDVNDTFTFQQSNTIPVITIDMSGGIDISGNAVKPGGGPWTARSDVSLKKNIKSLGSVLDKMLQLRGVRFEWRNPAAQGDLTGEQLGLIAQEVEKVMPQWVSLHRDGTKLLTIRGFEAMTIEAFRELKQSIDTLIKRIEALEGKRERAPAAQKAEVPAPVTQAQPKRAKRKPK